MKRSMSLLLALLALWILPGLSQAKDRTIYYHTDALGSVVAATDEHGDVLWRESYKPFGERQKREVGTEQNTPFYTGKPHDDITGLSYFGARYYDPEIGRFMGIDPVGVDPGNIHSFNRYAYANNNPYRFVDPDGMEPNPVWSLPDPTWNAIYSPNNNIQGDWIPDSPPNWYVRNRESIYTGLSIATSINPKGAVQTVTELPALLRKITKSADKLNPKLIQENPRNLISTQTKPEISSSRVKKFSKDMERNGFDQSKPVDAWRNPNTGRLEIQDGHHRTEAAKRAGLDKIPVQVWE